MRWTKERPTVAGFYWYRRDDDGPLIVEVALRCTGRPLLYQACGLDGWYEMGEFTEWAGPIPEPEADT